MLSICDSSRFDDYWSSFFLDMRHLRTVQCDMRCEFAPFFSLVNSGSARHHCEWMTAYLMITGLHHHLASRTSSFWSRRSNQFVSSLVISSMSLSRIKFFVSLLCITCQSFARISCGRASSLSDASRKSLISISTFRSTSYRLFWASSRFRASPRSSVLLWPRPRFLFCRNSSTSSSLIDPFFSIHDCSFYLCEKFLFSFQTLLATPFPSFRH